MRIETRHSVVLIAGTGITSLLGLIYNIYAGRVIGPAEYADFAAALSVVYLCSVAWGPINTVVTKFTAEYASRGEYGKIMTLSREILRRVAIYGVAGVAIGLAVLKPLSSILKFSSVVPLLMSYGIVYILTLLSVFRGILRGNQSFGQYNMNTILDAGFRLGVGVLLLGWSRAAASGVGAYLVAVTVIMLVARIQVGHVWRGYEPQWLDGAAVKRFTAPMFLLAFGGAGFQNLDMLFVKHYFVGSEAGLYGAAATLARSIGILLMPFSTFLLPLLASMYERGRRVGGTLFRICSYFVVLSAGLLLVFWLWPEQIIVSLYGADFAGAAPVLLPLAGALLIGGINGLFGLAFVSRNSFRFLYVYLAGLLALALGLSVFHESLLTVVTVVFAVQVGMLVPMLILFKCWREEESS
jgi:O-antigen/teichoic acid export membrane protein